MSQPGDSDSPTYIRDGSGSVGGGEGLLVLSLQQKSIAHKAHAVNITIVFI